MWIHAKVIPVQTMAHAWMKLWDSGASVLNSGEVTTVQVFNSTIIHVSTIISVLISEEETIVKVLILQ